jgi:hypothetical protein
MTRSNRPAPHRKFIAFVVCLSLAITGFSAVPARADEDVAKVLAGLAALAIIGKAIHDRRDDRREAHVTRRPAYTPPPAVQPRPLPPRVARFDLPGQCLREFRGYSGRKLLGEKCLQKNYRHTARLPQNCKVTFWNGRKNKTAYKSRCLMRQGYRIVQ